MVEYGIRTHEEWRGQHRSQGYAIWWCAKATPYGGVLTLTLTLTLTVILTFGLGQSNVNLLCVYIGMWNYFPPNSYYLGGGLPDSDGGGERMFSYYY